MCSAERASVLTHGPDYEYRTLPDRSFTMWRCDACGHGYLDPLPAPEELRDIYPATYYTVNPRSPIHFPERLYEIKMRRDVARIVSLIRGRSVRNIVDLGCGDAERLARLAEALPGAVAGVGVDLQPDASRTESLARRGVRMVEANFEEDLGVLRDGGHDLVVMSQILEHLRDPLGVLERLASKLAPGGRVLIETPNVGGIDYRLFRRRYWGAYHTPRHFHLFTRETLAEAARRAGLHVVSRGYIPSGFFIVSLRNALGLTSVERSRRFGEFLNMKNLPVVAAFSGFDLLCIALRIPTSNQYLLAGKR